MLRHRIRLKALRYGCLKHLFQRIGRMTAELARVAMVRIWHVWISVQ